MGVAYPGDLTNAGTWSGVPKSFLMALGDKGAEAVPLSAEPSGVERFVGVNSRALLRLPKLSGHGVVARLRLARTISMYTDPGYVAARTRAVSRALTRAGKLDGIIQIASAYELPNHRRSRDL